MTSPIPPDDAPPLVPSGIERPHQVRPAHLNKLAVVYVRQSSMEQVRRHTGSTDAQRALADVPKRWGWPDERIRTIDADLGQSGTKSAQRRGFQELLSLIDHDEVGLVIVRDVARLSRDPLDAEVFLRKAIRAGVLIEVNGRVFDTATEDLAELFGLRIQNLLAWFEVESNVRKFRSAKEARIRKGHAVSRPPIGYVEAVRGTWIKDPDIAVREAVRRIFDLYRRTRSIRKVERYHHEHNLLFPSRRRGELTWKPLAGLYVHHILRNQNYTSDYVYGRTKTTSPGDRDTPKITPRSPSEWLVAKHHHESYVTHEEWDLIQTLLAARRPRVRPAPGKGPALLQGLLWCAPCNRWMRTVYDMHTSGGVRVPRYLCRPLALSRVPRHNLTCSALLLDRVIVRDVLAALSPPTLEAALAVLADAKAEQASVRRAQARLLEQADEEVEEAQRRYVRVDPQHAMVKADLELKYEEALRRRDHLKRQDEHPQTPAVPLTTRDAQDLLALASDLHWVWNAATTTSTDRKQLLQTVITKILVQARTDDTLTLEVVWAGGLRESKHILRSPSVYRLVKDLHNAGSSPRAITQRLNTLGATTGSGKPFTENAVRMRLAALGVPLAQERRTARLRALDRVRQLVVDEGQPPRDALRLLQGEPHPYGGAWTRSRLWQAIHNLQRIPEVEASLRALLSAAAEYRAPVPATAIEIMRWGREAGRTWHAIANELNARGIRPPKAPRFSATQARLLFRILERRGLVDPRPDDRKRRTTDGAPSRRPKPPRRG